jgi:hypothetical protein
MERTPRRSGSRPTCMSHTRSVFGMDEASPSRSVMEHLQSDVPMSCEDMQRAGVFIYYVGSHPFENPDTMLVLTLCCEG